MPAFAHASIYACRSLGIQSCPTASLYPTHAELGEMLDRAVRDATLVCPPAPLFLFDGMHFPFQSKPAAVLWMSPIEERDCGHVGAALIDRLTVGEYDVSTSFVRSTSGASVHDPTNPIGRTFFNIHATFAKFDTNLIRMRTKEGMAIARAREKLNEKKPKLPAGVPTVNMVQVLLGRICFSHREEELRI